MNSRNSTPKKNHPDCLRLEALIQIREDGGSSDFDQMLFFASAKSRTDLAAYRRALDQWIKSRN